MKPLLMTVMVVVVGNIVANNLQAQLERDTTKQAYKNWLGRWQSISKGMKMEINFLDSERLIYTAAFAKEIEMFYKVEKVDNEITKLSIIFPTHITLNFFLWQPSIDQIKIIAMDSLPVKKASIRNLDEDFPKAIILVRKEMMEAN